VILPQKNLDMDALSGYLKILAKMILVAGIASLKHPTMIFQSSFVGILAT